MPDRSDERKSRRLGLVLGRWAIALLAVACTVQLVRLQLAIAARDAGDAPGALRTWPLAAAFEDEANLAFARQQLSDVVSNAQAALRRTSLTPISLRTLALASGSDTQQAGLLLTLASKLTWRDPASQLVLAAQEMEVGRYRSAALHLDVAARGLNGLPLASAALDRFLADNRLVGALGERMAPAPSWATAYFRDISSASPEVVSRRVQLLAAAKRAGLAEADDYAAPYIKAALDGGDIQQAFAFYRALYPTATSDTWRLAAGDFHQASTRSRLPFEWALTQNAGAYASVARDRQAHTSMRIYGDGTTAATVARRTVLLPPGRRSIELVVARGSAALEGLRWRVFCLAGNRGELFGNRYQTTKAGVSLVGYSFDVPTQGCDGQRIEISTDATSGAQPFTAVVTNVVLR